MASTRGTKRTLTLPTNVAPINQSSKARTGTQQRKSSEQVTLVAIGLSTPSHKDSQLNDDSDDDDLSFGDNLEEENNISKDSTTGDDSLTDEENTMPTNQDDSIVEDLAGSLLSTEEMFISAAKFAGEWIAWYSKRLQRPNIPQFSVFQFQQLFDECKDELSKKYIQNENQFRAPANLHPATWQKMKPQSLLGSQSNVY